MNLDTILATAIEAARSAGKILTENRDLGRVVEKSAYHFVTEADLRSETIILDMIRSRFPQHRIVSEESHQTESVLDADVWIIDPLDGTNNFSHGIPLFCVSIAFASQGQVQVGVIYDPNRDEMYWAVRGLGAFMNGQPIRVSVAAELKQAIICTGFYYDRGEMMRATLKAIETLFTHGVRGIRRLGSAALDLCWVANGRLDGFFEYRLAPWDYAAGWLLVAEAGGICVDRDGQPMRLDSNNILAATVPLHQILIDIVPWSKMQKAVSA